MNLQSFIKKILKEETESDLNIDGGKLEMCSRDPMTGFYRDGYCRTGDDDTGSHTVCARVTKKFLEFTNSMGNNLDMLEPGDKWCLCAKRWEEAKKAGVAPKMIKSSTNIKTLDIINGVEQELDEYARTLKNARRQGSGLRFPKSVVKSNPSRFRKYSREYINEIEFDDRTKKDYKVKTNFIKIFIEKNFGDLICGFHWDPINYVVNSKVYWPDKNLGAARIVLHIPNDKFEELETNDFLKKQDLKDQILQFPMFNQVFVTFDSTKCDEEMNESELTEKCWKGYTQKGMKTMFGKRYPNCVKKKK